MQRTPLYDEHVRRGGQMVDFAGWEMPIMYKWPDELGGGGGVHDEHKQVRSSGGFFDVSHMGRVRFKGRHARRVLERLCTRRVSDMQPGQCRYSLMCNDRGGVKDDVLVYRLDDDDFTVVVNASNREKLLPHFEEVKGDLSCTIDDRTMKTAMVAIQGPKVMDMVSQFSKEIPTLKRYRFVEKNYLVMKLLVSRTGYTGEDGVEVILPANMVSMAMKMLMKDVGDGAEAVVKPAGLGCRDTLRMEAGMALYGHELGEEIPALATGLGFAMDIDKDQDERGEPYVGMDALKQQRDNPTPTTLVGIELGGKRTARQGMTVLAAGEPAGEITSGCLSPTLGRPIAIAYVKREHAETGAAIEVDAGRSRLAGVVCALPFYKKPKKARAG